MTSESVGRNGVTLTAFGAGIAYERYFDLGYGWSLAFVALGVALVLLVSVYEVGKKQA